MVGLLQGTTQPGAMSLRKDQRGVSEIVGALMLVVVVSSAAFGFGVFMHQQSKITQEQKAAEQARKMEILDVASIVPLSTDLGAGCDIDPAGPTEWTSLTVRVSSRHLKETHVAGLRINGLAVQSVRVGATVHDFTLPADHPSYAPLIVDARSTVALILDNVADDGGTCSPAYNLAVPTGGSPPFPVSGGLEIAVLTHLNNAFEKSFVPPVALATLQPTPGAASSLTLIGTTSTPSTEGSSLVRWEWHVQSAVSPGVAACADDGTPEKVGHQAQVTVDLVTPTSYCFRLVVRDTDGLSSFTDIAFST